MSRDYDRIRERERKQRETGRPGSLIRYGRRRPTEAHGSGARKKRAKGSLASETRRPGWQPGLLIPLAVLSPTRYRTWPGRPKHRARCAEVPLANHGVHGYLRYRRDSSRNLRPSPQATQKRKVPNAASLRWIAPPCLDLPCHASIEMPVHACADQRSDRDLYPRSCISVK